MSALKKIRIQDEKARSLVQAGQNDFRAFLGCLEDVYRPDSPFKDKHSRTLESDLEDLMGVFPPACWIPYFIEHPRWIHEGFKRNDEIKIAQSNTSVEADLQVVHPIELSLFERMRGKWVMREDLKLLDAEVLKSWLTVLEQEGFGVDTWPVPPDLLLKDIRQQEQSLRQQTSKSFQCKLSEVLKIHMQEQHLQKEWAKMEENGVEGSRSRPKKSRL